jgi:NAD(P)-dependent dehydrogenase (short-subunit alcohol dehydrogenase family)
MAKNPRITWQRVDSKTLDLKGWKVAVVGGTGGLGRAISLALASRGANVTVVGQTFRDAGVERLNFIKADLSLMKEAQRVARELPAEQLDLVLFTTGIFAAPKREETREGLERDMATSYLNRVAMLRELGPRLGTARPAGRAKPRVFVMGYPGTGQNGVAGDQNSEKTYAAFEVHMNTVAGNEMLVLDGVTRYPALNFFGLNPGLIKTNIRDNFFGKDSLKSRVAEFFIGLITPTPEQYAERMLPLLVSPDLEKESGAMFDQKGNAVLPSPKVTEDAHRGAFLAESAQLVDRALRV